MSDSSASGNLSQLHDIVPPDAVSWWPPAPGWYVLCALLLLALVFGAWWGWQRWQTRRYRRLALAELRVLRDSHRDTRTAATQILILLKRTALAAYPRAQVAGLSGDHWWAFLDHTATDTAFVATFGPMAAELAYGAEPPEHATDPRLHSLFNAAERWIVTHHQPGGD